mmetsp:Transcript_23636/g.70677  ORF Transcript_23636/g.70677 Transcript_23636/m.70677 type:complete len:261 (-) Transcript_23636:249-1031(-)
MRALYAHMGLTVTATTSRGSADFSCSSGVLLTVAVPLVAAAPRPFATAAVPVDARPHAPPFFPPAALDTIARGFGREPVPAVFLEDPIAGSGFSFFLNGVAAEPLAGPIFVFRAAPPLLTSAPRIGRTGAFLPPRAGALLAAAAAGARPGRPPRRDAAPALTFPGAATFAAFGTAGVGSITSVHHDWALSNSLAETAPAPPPSKARMVRKHRLASSSNSEALGPPARMLSARRTSKCPSCRAIEGSRGAAFRAHLRSRSA